MSDNNKNSIRTNFFALDKNQKRITDYRAGDIKNFYKISEFYNFIQKPENAPITTRNHVLVPYPHNGNQYFVNRTAELYRMILSFHSITKMPDSGMLGGQDVSIITPLGRYTTISNSTYGTPENQFTANFLEMNIPIQESFLYEWYLTCFNSRIY